MLIEVQAADGVDSGRNVDDRVVMAKMQRARESNQSLLPYKLCTREVCVTGCTSDVRVQGRSSARELSEEARAAWNAADPPASSRFELARRLLEEVDGDERQAYCIAVHLANQGDAFITKRAIDIRSEVVAAFRKAPC
jgi:hypothetical protein